MPAKLASGLLAWIVVFCLVTNVTAEPQETAKKPGQTFLRLQQSEARDPIALETAIASYAPTKGSKTLVVDLVGAIHVADKSYYEKLNTAFKSYDAVLYELVAPRGATPMPGERSFNSVSFLQLTMKNVLELQFQLDCVDYDESNFVHADMTPEEFAKSMANRGESFAQMFLRMLGQSIAIQSKDPARSSDAELLAALLDPKRRSLRLKRLMASQFQDMEAAASVLDGPNGSTILTERNKTALRVLAREIKTGKARIAIFYGAAHLPDMEERLIKDFGLKRTGTKWLTAWDLHDAEAKNP